MCKLACVTATKDKLVMVAGEITTKAKRYYEGCPWRRGSDWIRLLC
jgi:S-adenosylmethionine synthetase